VVPLEVTLLPDPASPPAAARSADTVASAGSAAHCGELAPNQTTTSAGVSAVGEPSARNGGLGPNQTTTSARLGAIGELSARNGGLARNRITAVASIVAVAGPGGVTRLPVLASQVPLVLRRTPDAVYLVGGAAGPIGGDELSLRIRVAEGAFLRVRTAAASIALPGPDGLESVLRISVSVGPGARLEYQPEPVVVTAGARHATIVSAWLDEGASLLLRDELLLGRYGEDGGTARTVLRVDYAGRPLLRQELEVNGTDDASLGPAVLAGHRAVGTVLHVNRSSDEPSERLTATSEVAALPLAGPGVLVTAVARDAVALRQRLTSG
jgi:urease accessory protein